MTTRGVLTNKWFRLLRRFAVARDAVAAVEFALIMPFMLTLYLGSMELSQLINVDQRVTNVAGTIGDLAARTDGTLAKTVLTDYFTAATAIISPFSATGLGQVVTEVLVKSDGTNVVQWSVAYNGGVAKTVGQAFPGPHGIPPSMIAISKGSYVIVSEATYSYLPLLGLFFKTPFSLYHENFYLPRYAANITYSAST